MQRRRRLPPLSYDDAARILMRHPELGRNEFTVFGCFLQAIHVNLDPCSVCATAYKMYLGNAKRRRARATEATQYEPDPN